MIINIIYIVIGIICFLVGLIATIIAFACVDPIDHMWSIPLMILGVFFVYISFNNMVDCRVNEKLQQYNIVQNVVGMKIND